MIQYAILIAASAALAAAQSPDSLMEQRRFHEARRAYLALHAERSRTLGPEHPQTILALGNACDASVQQADRINALAICNKALALREKVLGPNAQDTARTLSDLALIHAAEGHLNQAIRFVTRALAIAEADPRSPDTPGLLNNFGFLRYRQGHYAESRRAFERALGGQTADRSTILCNLAITELAIHDAVSAKRHFSEAAEEAGPNQSIVLKARRGLEQANAQLHRKPAVMTEFTSARSIQ